MCMVSPLLDSLGGNMASSKSFSPIFLRNHQPTQSRSVLSLKWLFCFCFCFLSKAVFLGNAFYFSQNYKGQTATWQHWSSWPSWFTWAPQAINSVIAQQKRVGRQCKPNLLVLPSKVLLFRPLPVDMASGPLGTMLLTVPQERALVWLTLFTK